MTTGAPLLSVVVAHAPGAAEDPSYDWLRAIESSCRGIDAEVIAVGFDGAPAPATSRVVVAAPRGSLTPDRWGLGLARARGRFVAFTTDLCVVDDGWARAAVDALSSGAAAAGGPIRPAARLGGTARAVHSLRFGRLPSDDRAVHDVAADNAAYVRETLLSHCDDPERGFWEVEANRRLLAAGHRLEFRVGMSVTFTGGESLGTLMSQRFHHGRHAGAWRVSTGARRRWQVVLAAPLVPLVLLKRAVKPPAGNAPLPIGALPNFLALASAWAAGEALGAIARPDSL